MFTIRTSGIMKRVLQLALIAMLIDQLSFAHATYIPNLFTRDTNTDNNQYEVDGSRIPGFNTSWNDFLHMNAGILSVDKKKSELSETDEEKSKSGLFFWDFKMVGNSSSIDDRPLVIWLNGGPGCSSMDGALMEVGPLRVNRKSEVEWNKGWFEKVDLLFVDQPVGTGFSPIPSSGYTTNLEESSQHLINFLEFYFDTFPQLENKYNNIIIAGESYAGQYIPHFARAIKDHERFSSKLSAIMLGNAWLDPNLQSLSYVPYVLDRELIHMDSEIDQMKFTNLLKKQDKCQNVMNQADVNKIPFEDPNCESILNKLLQSFKPSDSRCINVYDIKKEDSYPQCGLNWPEILPETTNLLNLESVQAALHVSGGSPWSECNSKVHKNYKPASGFNAAKLLEALLNEGVKVNLFSGVDDLICNYIGTENVMKTYISGYMHRNNYLFEEETTDFVKREVKKLTMDSDWYHDDIKAGSFWQRGNLTYVKVDNASHMVAYDVSVSSIGLIELALREDSETTENKEKIETFTTDPRSDPDEQVQLPSIPEPASPPNESEKLKSSGRKIIAMCIMLLLIGVLAFYAYKLAFGKPKRYSALARPTQPKHSAYTRYAYEWMSGSAGSGNKKKKVHWIDDEEVQESGTDDLELGDIQDGSYREGSLEDREMDDLSDVTTSTVHAKN